MIEIICIGKKHESWVKEGIEMYQKRLKKPWGIKWNLLPHSNFEADMARQEESERILSKVDSADFLILLDERGKNINSIELSNIFERNFVNSKKVVVVIGGAYGVDQSVFERANFVWSLSKLVFPHQLVRLLLTEQIYRSQEIALGGKYHHV